MRPHVDEVLPSTPFPTVVMRLLALPAAHDLYVTAVDGAYLGVIVLDELKGHLGDREDLGVVTAADVMSVQTRPITLEMSLDQAIDLFAETDLERLPVVDANDDRLVGTVARRDLLRRGVV